MNDLPVRPPHHAVAVPGIHVAQHPCPHVQAGVEQGHEQPVVGQPGDRLRGQPHPGRRAQLVGRAAQRRPQRRHHQGCSHPLAHHVRHREVELAALRTHPVVEVAPHVLCGNAGGGQLVAVQQGPLLGQQLALDLDRSLDLLLAGGDVLQDQDQ